MKKVICTIFVIMLFMSGYALFSEEQKAGNTTHVPEIKEWGGFWYVYMEFEGSYAKLGEGAKTFSDEMKKQHLKGEGPLFVTFYNPPKFFKQEECRWAISMALDKNIEIKAPLKRRQAPKHMAVTLLHTDLKKNVRESFPILDKYFLENRYRKLWPAYEVYDTDKITIVHPIEYPSDKK